MGTIISNEHWNQYISHLMPLTQLPATCTCWKAFAFDLEVLREIGLQINQLNLHEI